LSFTPGASPFVNSMPAFSSACRIILTRHAFGAAYADNMALIEDAETQGSSSIAQRCPAQ
jgi:hypothetical protein